MKKTFTHSFGALAAGCLLLLAQAASAQTTYTTILDGNWSNFEIWDIMVVPPNPLPSGDIINVGHVVLMTGDITINNGAALNINSMGGDLNDGGMFQFAIYNSGTLTNNGMLYPGNGLTNSSTFTNNGTLTEPFLINNSPMTNNGTANIGFDSHNYSTFTNSGTGILNINDYTNNQPGGTLINNGTMNINSGFDNNGTVTNNGMVTVGGGTFTQNGTYNGSGTYDGSSFTNQPGEIVAPGNSPGCLTFSSGFTNDGTLEIESANGAACVNYDKIIVTGDVTLGGIINITFPSGTPSSPITILSATGLKTNNSPTINMPAGFTGTGAFVGNDFQVSFSPLPVELVFFTAKENNHTVQLEWQTASENNNEGFQIERSTDGERWNNLGFVAGHGTTQLEHSYTYTDERPLPGLNYYRLRQVDFDGKSEYSKIVSVEMKNGGSGIHLFPNPATGSVTLAFETDYSGEATLTLYDLLGKQMKTQVLSLDGSGAIHTSIDLAGLPSGMYQMDVLAGHQQWQERLVVE